MVLDSVTLDADGYLWVAIHGASELRRYSPQGEIKCIVRLPVCGVTSCAFGGEELTDLYMTSMVVFNDGREPLAGALFRCTPEVRGRPTRLFAG
jgi:sugar lactone lactonase YvrE